MDVKVGPAVQLKETKCLDCGYTLDAATGVGGGRKPKPGHITICMMCGHIMAFAKDMTMRPLTDEEMHAVAGDDRILAIQAARKKVFKL